MHLTSQSNEKWVPIIGFEEFYIVSSKGRVKSLPNEKKYRKNQSVILKPRINFGYACVTLVKNSKNYYKRINRIVAENFIPNTKNKPCVNHINGIKTDNCVENLEWVTYSENEIHSYSVLNKNLKGIKKTFKNDINPRSKKILCIEKNIVFNSIAEASKSINAQRANIAAHIKGKYSHVKGFTFKLI